MRLNRCKLANREGLVFDRWLVVSDLDGTLLNHHDYRVTEALPMLQQLEKMAIPVIFNTSKTFAELRLLVQQLGNRHPFIVENGSAVAIPEDYFPKDFQDKHLAEAQIVPGYRVIVTGRGVDEINAFVGKIDPGAINFNECPLHQAMELTGLSASEASHAQQREYSVPLIFANTDQQTRFIQQAERAGFSTLRGGRFLHVLGLTDKGSSMQLLKQLYELHEDKKFGVIALGDSLNDYEMLEQSDRPVVVKSPSSVLLKLHHPNVIYTRQDAPEGWVEGVQVTLKQLQLNRLIMMENSYGG